MKNTRECRQKDFLGDFLSLELERELPVPCTLFISRGFPIP